MKNKYLKEFQEIYQNYKEFDRNKIPLCAAETYVSDFTKQALNSEFEGKYIQGYKNRILHKDNIGSDYLYPLLDLVEKMCKDLYGADYVDCRTLTGMNCIAILAMALIDKDSTVIITTKEMGGHPSLANILDNLGIHYESVPYNFDLHQVDYEKLDHLLKTTNNLSFLIFCQSDIIEPVDFKKIQLPDHVGLIYDGSQTLGLIAAGLLDNPLDYYENVILIGGTHKTLPGPTCGLIMTKNKSYEDQIDFTISPTLLRNIQPNNIASLCLALIEQIETGRPYQEQIVKNANILGLYIEEKGIKVQKISDGTYTRTHQLFVLFPQENVDMIYKNAVHFNITLNKRISKLYTGIRLGVQEITRYSYSQEDLKCLANLIHLISDKAPNDELVRSICRQLACKKNPNYILDDIFMI